MVRDMKERGHVVGPTPMHIMNIASAMFTACRTQISYITNIGKEYKNKTKNGFPKLEGASKSSQKCEVAAPTFNRR